LGLGAISAPLGDLPPIKVNVAHAEQRGTVVGDFTFAATRCGRFFPTVDPNHGGVD
jgi:hypothetical protein